MKTLISSLKFESSDPAQFRFHVLEHGEKYGVSSAIEAFGVSRRSYFRWKKKLRERSRLADLVPHSTTPKRTRRMMVDDQIVALIRSIRQEYGRVGKYKLKILLNAYSLTHNLPLYSPTKIGKIVKRYNFFFEKPKRTRKLRFQRERVKHAPHITLPGYLEMDSIHIMVSTQKLVFITVIDLATKVAYAECVSSAKASASIEVLAHFITLYNLAVYTVQTDNGSEFLGVFHEYLATQNIKHVFSYPRSPRINGVIERFNRTLQEEHIERTLEWWCDPEIAQTKLTKYLEWYNATRPHAALKYQTPLAYLHTYT